MSIGRRLTGLVLAFAAVCPAFATEYTVDPAESIFAVVVHKAGIAARFAHNHLVYPNEYTSQLSLENGDPATAQFSLSFPTEKLLVDAADMHKKWYPALEKAGILDEPFKELDEKDRAAIAEHMLDVNQLDAKQYPEISAKLVTLRAEASSQGKQQFTHKAMIEFTVHGRTVSRECPASLTLETGRVVIDAMGEFKFSEFGIKPYSAMAGAVKNNDTFHAFVHISATTKS
jgi:polyisoprenoid-binding protein YceI